jgi:hypothetical protein
VHLTGVDGLAVLRARLVLDEGEVRRAAQVRQRTQHHQRQRQEAGPTGTAVLADRRAQGNTVPNEMRLRFVNHPALSCKTGLS